MFYRAGNLKTGRFVQICEKMPLPSGFFDKFVENYATMPPLRGIGFKDRSFGGIFLGKEVPKPFFDCGGPGCRIISGYMPHTPPSDDIPQVHLGFGPYNRSTCISIFIPQGFAIIGFYNAPTSLVHGFGIIIILMHKIIYVAPKWHKLCFIL